MLRLLTCLDQDHDLWLVLVAVVVCGIGSHTALTMLGRMRAHRGPIRAAWFAGAALAFGCGVWSTHFVAMLAYLPGIGAGFGLFMTAVSLLAAIGGGGAGFALASLMRGWIAPAAGGLVLAAAIGAMHFIGMAAIDLPALVLYDHTLIAMALLTGGVLSAAALAAARRRLFACGTAALSLAICGLHFIAMAAVTLMPWGEPGIAAPAEPDWAIAAGVSATSLLLLGLGLGGVMFDQHLTHRARREAARLREFADATFEGILFHRDGVVIDANAAFATLRGSAEPVAGQPLSALFAGRLPELSVPSPLASEAELLTADGGRPVEILRRTIERNGEPTGVLALRDLTARRQAEHAIERLAHYDPLTGLANRALFRDRLAQALATAQRLGHSVALLCIDLDRFKTVNDLLGHPAGDQLLAMAALRLGAGAREMDTAARLGADEFAIVVPMCTQSGAAHLAARLTEALGAPYAIAGQAVTISASIGIGLFPEDGQSCELLLRHADLALSRAKQSGRACYRFYEEAMDAKQQDRARLEQDLRHAIEQGAGEQGTLSLHYQPQFDSRTLRLCGYEALVRWTHPERGTVSPAEFVPIAEECGLIRPLSEWVLRTACAEAATWPAALSVAVNLSPAEFEHRSEASDALVARVAAVLAQTGLAAHRLELEITEGVLIKDTDRAVATLQALGALGVRVAMDDFGTGYSSLGYLQRFPFDKIKIDRSFVRTLDEGASGNSIVGAIIGLGRSLKVMVTAEGVETAAQLARLRQMQCDHVQGFLLGRPAPADQLLHEARQRAVG